MIIINIIVQFISNKLLICMTNLKYLTKSVHPVFIENYQFETNQREK
jgi:hypothetical protein